MIVSGSVISPDEKDQWFQDLGMTLDFPAGIQLNNAIIGVEFKKDCCADLCILGTEQGQKLTPYEKTRPWFFGHQFKPEILFYAEFSPHRNKYSWAIIASFLKLLYDQSTYVKKLSMYSLDKKLKGILFADEEQRYIRCGSFTLQVSIDTSVEDLCESVSWLEQNVQADMIQIPSGIHYNDSDICDAMSEFLLGASWISSRQVIKLGRVNDLRCFFTALIKKFRTHATVQSIFPTILFSGSRRIQGDPLEKLLSGEGIVEEKRGKSENSEDDSDGSQSDDNRIPKRNYGIDDTYTISNGANRMRIEFVKEMEKPRCRRICRVCSCGRSAYGYDIRVTIE